MTRPDIARDRGAARPADAGVVWGKGFDSPLGTYHLLIGCTVALLIIGLTMVLSASAIHSLEATKGASAISEFVSQARFALIGVACAAGAVFMPVGWWKRAAIPIFLAACVLQALVLWTPLGSGAGGNRNWLRLGPIGMQPSELGKLALVLVGARILAFKRPRLGDWMHAFVPFVVPVAAGLMGLVLLGRDLGTCLVLAAIVGGMLMAAGVSWRLLVGTGLAGAVGVAALVLTSGNRMERIAGWRQCDDPTGTCWQTAHAMYALADGGISGTGPGASREKWGWLPEPHNDFIFAIIGEELGLLGALLVLLLFGLLAWAFVRVIVRSRDPFVHYSVAGVLVWVVVQACVNIGSVIGLLPVIGVPLPLVSSGGSALVTTMIALGMVASFARADPQCKTALSRRPWPFARSFSVIARSRKARS